MSDDTGTDLTNEFFQGGWRVAPFIKTTDGYIGVKAWPKRAAVNQNELTILTSEHSHNSSKIPILGIVPPKGRYIIDIDFKKNPGALQLWTDRVVEAYGDQALAWPNLVVKTKSGGYHLYYSDGSDRLIHSPTSVFGSGSGVDIRGYTGMVVAPTYMGTESDWQPGDYAIVRGSPLVPLTVLGLSKIVADFDDGEDLVLRSVLKSVNEVLRNRSVPQHLRLKQIPNDLLIPSSNRDNTLYRCARLCRLADLDMENASLFMAQLALRCETSAEEPAEHWIKISQEKVKRVYADDRELKLRSVSAFYEELDNAGTVQLRGVSRSYLYFRHGSSILRIDPRSKFSVENLPNVLQGLAIYSDDEQIAARKCLANYSPKEVAYADAMMPKSGVPFFEYQGRRYVNTYHDPFETFEPVPSMLDRAAQYVERFQEFVRHVTGYDDGDSKRLLDKLAWIVQKPYRRMPTGTIIYSHTKGSGKDTFMLLVREIVGQEYYMPVTLKSMQQPHFILHDKLVCTASEVQLQANARGSREASAFMGDLKDLITSKHVEVNEKFVQGFNAPIYANFFVLSNFELSPILEPGDRRWDIFHACEEKMDQSLFGDLADIGSDGVWLDRSAEEQLFRRHVVYAIRTMLKNRRIDTEMDRMEAVENDVKRLLMETQNPPVLNWMYANLPVYFTDDVAMMACHFSPIKAMPEYIMRQLKEHFGPQMRPIYRSNRIIHRMNGSPKIEMKASNSGPIPTLNFDVKTSDPTARRSVYTLDNTLHEVSPSDVTMKAVMRKWYEGMVQKFHGNLAVLPNQKPDV